MKLSKKAMRFLKKLKQLMLSLMLTTQSNHIDLLMWHFKNLQQIDILVEDTFFVVLFLEEVRPVLKNLALKSLRLYGISITAEDWRMLASQCSQVTQFDFSKSLGCEGNDIAAFWLNFSQAVIVLALDKWDFEKLV